MRWVLDGSIQCRSQRQKTWYQVVHILNIEIQERGVSRAANSLTAIT